MSITEHAHGHTLHERIVVRRREMQRTLASLRSVVRTATCVRARAIDESLKTLDVHLGGDWNGRDRDKSAALTHWLDRSRYLYDVTPPPLRAKR